MISAAELETNLGVFSGPGATSLECGILGLECEDAHGRKQVKVTAAAHNCKEASQCFNSPRPPDWKVPAVQLGKDLDQVTGWACGTERYLN